MHLTISIIITGGAGLISPNFREILLQKDLPGQQFDATVLAVAQRHGRICKPIYEYEYI